MPYSPKVMRDLRRALLHATFTVILVSLSLTGQVGGAPTGGLSLSEDLGWRSGAAEAVIVERFAGSSLKIADRQDGEGSVGGDANEKAKAEKPAAEVPQTSVDGGETSGTTSPSVDSVASQTGKQDSDAPATEGQADVAQTAATGSPATQSPPGDQNSLQDVRTDAKDSSSEASTDGDGSSTRSPPEAQEPNNSDVAPSTAVPATSAPDSIKPDVVPATTAPMTSVPESSKPDGTPSPPPSPPPVTTVIAGEVELAPSEVLTALDTEEKKSVVQREVGVNHLKEILELVAAVADVGGVKSKSTLNEVLGADPEMAAVVNSDPVLEGVLKAPALGTAPIDDPVPDLQAVLDAEKGKEKPVEGTEEKREVVVVKDGNGKDILKTGAKIDSKYSTEIVFTARGVLMGTPQRFAEDLRMISAEKTASTVRIVQIRVSSAARRAAEEGAGGRKIKETKRKLTELLAKRKSEESKKSGVTVLMRMSKKKNVLKNVLRTPPAVVQVILVVESDTLPAKEKAVLALNEWVITKAYSKYIAIVRIWRSGAFQMTLALKDATTEVKDTAVPHEVSEPKKSLGGVRLSVPSAIGLGIGILCLCVVLVLLTVWAVRSRSSSSSSNKGDCISECSDGFETAAVPGEDEGERAVETPYTPGSVIIAPYYPGYDYSDYSGGPQADLDDVIVNNDRSGATDALRNALQGSLPSSYQPSDSEPGHSPWEVALYNSDQSRRSTSFSRVSSGIDNWKSTQRTSGNKLSWGSAGIN